MNANRHINRLSWIEQLPEVGTPILRQRDDLLTLLAQIDALQEIATRRRQALEEEISALWLPVEIDLAKRHIGV